MLNMNHFVLLRFSDHFLLSRDITPSATSFPFNHSCANLFQFNRELDKQHWNRPVNKEHKVSTVPNRLEPLVELQLYFSFMVLPHGLIISYKHEVEVVFAGVTISRIKWLTGNLITFFIVPLVNRHHPPLQNFPNSFALLTFYSSVTAFVTSPFNLYSYIYLQTRDGSAAKPKTHGKHDRRPKSRIYPSKQPVTCRLCGKVCYVNTPADNNVYTWISQ